MENFRIAAELVTPIIVNTLTLDGLLGAVIFDQLQDIELAHAKIPLRCRDGLFHASVAQFKARRQPGRQTLIAGLRASHDLNLDWIQKNPKDPDKPRNQLGLSRRSQFGNVMNSYATTEAQEVFWDAQGDPEAVLALLENTHFIGKKRTAGFGQVKAWYLQETDVDGVTDKALQPMRPVPLDRWDGDPNALRADAAWRPAYWMPQHRAICVVPQPGVPDQVAAT